MGICPQSLGAPNDSGGHLSTSSGGHTLCLKRSYPYALLGTGIRLGSLEGWGKGTELSESRKNMRVSVEMEEGRKLLLGPAWSLQFVMAKPSP